MGLDPNVWFGSVELAAARVISRKPVIYARNILKYHVSYRLFRERREHAKAGAGIRLSNGSDDER
jgi:hypothetical protein